MKTKFRFIIPLLMAITLFLPLASKAADDAPAGKTLYTCGMHPQIVQDHPGDCPICGMKLRPIRNDAATPVATNASSTAISIDSATMQNMNLRLATISRGPLRRTIRTVGTIEYNETAMVEVNTRFKGWVEQLYAASTGQFIHRGDPMFEVDSPDIYSAEVEYLVMVNSMATNEANAALLHEAASDKLHFYGISDSQIADLRKTRQAQKTVTIQSPLTGIITEKMVVRGQMVDVGQTLYRLADPSIVWVYAQIYEQDMPFVKLGQEAVVRIVSQPDQEFRGRVTFVYPTVDPKTRTARVRMEFENPGYFLKPGMFVSVEVAADLAPSALLVPESAVLRSGTKNTVFVALDAGKFEARTVVLGADAADGQCEVLSGLRDGDRVVTSGQFMLDSESQLREAIEKMNSAPASATNSPSAATNQPTAASASVEGVVYVCPMPEHLSITYDHPGNCPICGMALVPVKPSDLKKLQPTGKILYWTCPMPEHSSVHEDKPGKCPLCQMTLIPVTAPPEISAPTNNSK